MGCICAVEEGSHHLAHSQQPNYQAQAVPHAMVTKAAVIAVPAGCNAPPFQCPIRTSCQKLPAWIRVSSSRGQLLAVIGATKGPFRRTQACPHTMTIWMTTFTMSAPALPNMFCEEVGSLSRQLLSPGPSERGHEVGEGWWACQRCSDQLRRQETGLCMQPCTVLSAGRQHCSNLWSGVVHGADWWKIHVQFVPVLCLVHVGESSEPVAELCSRKKFRAMLTAA